VKPIDNLTGKVLGDYRLLKKLTSGGMAQIYLGEDEKLGRNAAIKILTPEMAGSDDTLKERFDREARAVARLEHDNIITIYQYGEQADLYFIAMRYIEGNDLADELKKHKDAGTLMSVRRALYILGQVAAALDYAHSHDIIHRDVKPSNILLGSDDKAVLSDFGLVLWQSSDQTLGTAFGTPRYISPEQATDSQSAVPQSDVYSLAVIMYEILTNEVMFRGKTPMEVALAHITETPTPPRAINPEIPANAQTEIMKALQKDASKRHATAMELIRAIRGAYKLDDTQPIEMPPPIAMMDDVLNTTIPLTPDEIASDTGSSASAILDSWDIPPPNDEEPDTTPAPDHDEAQRQEKGSSRLGLVALLIFVVLAVGSAAFGILGDDNPLSAIVDQVFAADTSAAVATPEENAVAVQATDDPAASAPPTETAVPTNTVQPANTVAATATTQAADTPVPATTVRPTSTPRPSNTPRPTHTPRPSETPRPTDTAAPSSTSPSTNTAALAMSSTGAAMLLLYNDGFFAVANRNDTETLLIGGLLIAGANGDQNGESFDNTLPPGQCVVFKLSGQRDSDIPAEWECDMSQRQLPRDQSVFWRADSASDEVFTIFNQGEVLATCETVGRAVGRVENMTCQIEWNSVQR